MRNRTSLALMELVLMFFVFALAAAWCLKGFLWADHQSEQQRLVEQAMWQAQNVAEVVKETQGDFLQVAEITEGISLENGLILCFDENWEKSELESVYTLKVEKEESGLDLLGQAVIEVKDKEQVLATLHVGWQEVEEDE